MNDNERKKLAKELTNKYISEWLSSERKTIHIKECTEYFLIAYNLILRELKENCVFNKPIDELSKTIALVYTTENLQREELDIEDFIKIFTKSYKAALKIVDKETSIKSNTVKVPVFKKTSPLKSLPKYEGDLTPGLISTKTKVESKLTPGLISTKTKRKKRRKTLPNGLIAY